MQTLDGPIALDGVLPSLTGGPSRSLAETKGQNALVIVFFNEVCGVTYSYRARLEELVKLYTAKGYAFVGIRTGRRDAGGVPETGWFPAPLYDDADDALRQRFAVGQSMTCAVVDRGGTLRYLGGFDDRVRAKDVRQTYLADALQSLAMGRSVRVKRGKALGCAILPPL